VQQILVDAGEAVSILGKITMRDGDAVEYSGTLEF